MNQETIQQKIQLARRDAEALKDRIKRKKDELADTTRTLSAHHALSHTTNICLQCAMSPETVLRPCRASQ
jgi:hypothetical protein